MILLGLSYQQELTGFCKTLCSLNLALRNPQGSPILPVFYVKRNVMWDQGEEDLNTAKGRIAQRVACWEERKQKKEKEKGRTYSRCAKLQKVKLEL